MKSVGKYFKQNRTILYLVTMLYLVATVFSCIVSDSGFYESPQKPPPKIKILVHEVPMYLNCPGTLCSLILLC